MPRSSDMNRGPGVVAHRPNFGPLQVRELTDIQPGNEYICVRSVRNTREKVIVTRVEDGKIFYYLVDDPTKREQHHYAIDFSIIANSVGFWNPANYIERVS